MTDTQKAAFVMMATNDGQELPEHQLHVVKAALRGELGRATKMVFDDLYRQVLESELEKSSPT